MKREHVNDEELRALLKKNTLMQPDKHAAARLKASVIATYQKPESVSLTFNQWPARVIALLAIVSGALFLGRIGPVFSNPAILVILGLTTSIWALIFLSLRVSVNQSTYSSAVKKEQQPKG